MKFFNKILMASEEEVYLLKAGYFQDSNGDLKEVEDGAAVSIKGLKDHALYSGMKDMNARVLTAYDSAYPIWGIVDFVGRNEANVAGVTYRIGGKVPGVHPLAGEITRVRVPAVGDEFYLGNENFTVGTAAATGKYAAPANGKTTYDVSNAAPQSGPYFLIEDARDLVMGMVNEGTKMYRCRALKV